jgi:hypothetical protein
MGLIGKRYLRFDEEDVQLMKDMLARFHEFHKGTGMPDYTAAYSAYLPVFAVALLTSQESVNRLSKKLLILTWVIAGFTAVLVVLTLVLSGLF